jgi:hypothetical protein
MARLKAQTTGVEIKRFVRIVGLPPTITKQQLSRIDFDSMVKNWKDALDPVHYPVLSPEQKDLLRQKFLNIADAAKQLKEWAAGMWETEEQREVREKRAVEREILKARAVDTAAAEKRRAVELAKAVALREAKFKAQRERAEREWQWEQEMKRRDPAGHAAWVAGSIRGSEFRRRLVEYTKAQEREYLKRTVASKKAQAGMALFHGFGSLFAH